MATTISFSMLLSLVTLFVLSTSINVESSYDDVFLPLKRTAAVSWLQENTNKHHNYQQNPDDVTNNPHGNCQEISIDLNLEKKFMPSIIQHVYCHNMDDPHAYHCSYKGLTCHQKTEPMFIADKSQSCMKGPEEHRRPIGCECKTKLYKK